MPKTVSSTVQDFSEALRNISGKWTERQRLGRRLLLPDPLEKLVPVKLLQEGVAQLIENLQLDPHPVVLFMDRTGGGEGARAAASIMPLIADRWPGFVLVHISFATPSQGLGTLVRNTLVMSGGDLGVTVYVVAHNRPVEGLKLSAADADRLVAECDLVISFSPGGAAGLAPVQQCVEKDLLLAKSHLAVLSYPDPEAVVAQLPTYKATLSAESSIDALRFWVQVEDEGSFEDLDYTVLGEQGDAEERLWALIDNARRRCYRVLVEPLNKGLPVGDSLHCPCRTEIAKVLASSGHLSRIVPAGSRLVAVARGCDTLT